MTEKLCTPSENPELAAQEILALLAEAGSFTPQSGFLSGSDSGEAVAKAMIAIHKSLTAYYKTLSQ